MIAAAAATGYSGTPLPQKLGLKDGQRVHVDFAAARAEGFAQVAQLRRDRGGRLGHVHRMAIRAMT